MFKKKNDLKHRLNLLYKGLITRDKKKLCNYIKAHNQVFEADINEKDFFKCLNLERTKKDRPQKLNTNDYNKYREIYIKYMYLEIENSSQEVDLLLDRLADLKYGISESKNVLVSFVIGIFASAVLNAFVGLNSSIQNTFSILENIIFRMLLMLVHFFLVIVSVKFIYKVKDEMILFSKDWDYFLTNELEITLIINNLNIKDYNGFKTYDVTLYNNKKKYIKFKCEEMQIKVEKENI